MTMETTEDHKFIIKSQTEIELLWSIMFREEQTIMEIIVVITIIIRLLIRDKEKETVLVGENLKVLEIIETIQIGIDCINKT